jgi:hypothetical protein
MRSIKIPILIFIGSILISGLLSVFMFSEIQPEWLGWIVSILFGFLSGTIGGRVGIQYWKNDLQRNTNKREL